MLASQPLVCLLKVQKCMKRMFKQLWSTILPISTKRTTISHLNSLNTKKKTTTYDIENPDPGLGQAQKKYIQWSLSNRTNQGTSEMCRIVQNVRILTEILWDHKCLSHVTGCQKTQVSDCTSSTVCINLHDILISFM